MGKYCELVKKAIAKGYEDEAWAVMDETLEKMKRKNPDLYDDVMDALECLAYKIPMDEAVQIVKEMRPKGQNWSYQQVKDWCHEKGVDKDIINWYLVLNMMYNDYYGTAKHFGHEDDDVFYWCLAKNFIEDPDAKPFKVEKYFLD